MFYSVEFAFTKKLMLCNNEDMKTYTKVMAFDQDVCNIQHENLLIR